MRTHLLNPKALVTQALAAVGGADQPGLFDARPMTTGEPLMVPIDQLGEDPHNPRTEFPAPHIDELAQDIAQRGVLQPIVAAKNAAGRYLMHQPSIGPSPKSTVPPSPPPAEAGHTETAP